MTLSETVCSDWCEPVCVENRTSELCVSLKLLKVFDLKLANGGEEVIRAQTSDKELIELYKKALSVEEAGKGAMYYFVKDGVLMRKFRPPAISAINEEKVYKQIVVPSKYRSKILELPHSLPMTGHLGVNKTQDRIRQHFYWQRLRMSVAE